MGAEVLFEIAESVICVKIGLPVQAKKFSERINNAHNPFNFLSVFGHAGVDLKEVNSNDLPGVRAVFKFTVPVFMLGVIYGFCEKATFA